MGPPPLTPRGPRRGVWQERFDLDVPCVCCALPGASISQPKLTERASGSLVIASMGAEEGERSGNCHDTHETRSLLRGGVSSRAS